MNNIDPSLAVDLSKVKDKQQVPDLSKEGTEARAKQVRLKKAASKARRMNSAFKGILGAPTRRQHVQQVIKDYDLA